MPALESDDAAPSRVKLSAEDVRDALRPVKESALCQCKALAQGGEAVAVELTVEGASGTVVAVRTAEDPLSRCLADHIRQARFPRFSQAEQEAKVSVRF